LAPDSVYDGLGKFYSWDIFEINEDLKMSDKENHKIIDPSISGEGKMPAEELWLKMSAAFEANDVETMEILEKQWFCEG
jgi:hypothetical protein